MKKENLSITREVLLGYLLLILDKLTFIDQELTTKIKNKQF